MTVDKRKYLQPEMVAKLNNMSLRARMVVEGYILGLHKSPYHGFSVEFAEHRAYGPGDEIRHIDWKLYGKTDRYYVKQFEEETNLRTHLIVDISRSMTYGSGKVTKIEYAEYLSAALSYLMLSQQDAVGLVTFDTKIRQFIPPHSNPGFLNTLLAQLNQIQPGADTKIGPVLHEMAERIKKRGLVILISDLLDQPESVLEGLKHFRHNKQEVVVFHILDRQELKFDFSTRTRFRDLETAETIITEPWQIQERYTDLINRFQDYYRRRCREQRIDYIPFFTDQNLDLALNGYLQKRQRLG